MSQLRPFEERIARASSSPPSARSSATTWRRWTAKVAKLPQAVQAADALPYYAVIFEQQVGPAAIRRHGDGQPVPLGDPPVDRIRHRARRGPPHWRVFPHPTQKKAIEAAEHWMSQGH